MASRRVFSPLLWQIRITWSLFYDTCVVITTIISGIQWAWNPHGDNNTYHYFRTKRGNRFPGRHCRPWHEMFSILTSKPRKYLSVTFARLRSWLRPRETVWMVKGRFPTKNSWRILESPWSVMRGFRRERELLCKWIITNEITKTHDHPVSVNHDGSSSVFSVLFCISRRTRRKINRKTTNMRTPNISTCELTFKTYLHMHVVKPCFPTVNEKFTNPLRTSMNNSGHLHQNIQRRNKICAPRT